MSDEMFKLLGNVKKEARNKHIEMMRKIPLHKRSQVQAQLNNMINKAKSENKSNVMNGFLEDIYGR